MWGDGAGPSRGPALENTPVPRAKAHSLQRSRNVAEGRSPLVSSAHWSALMRLVVLVLTRTAALGILLFISLY